MLAPFHIRPKEDAMTLSLRLPEKCSGNGVFWLTYFLVMIKLKYSNQIWLSQWLTFNLLGVSYLIEKSLHFYFMVLWVGNKCINSTLFFWFLRCSNWNIQMSVQCRKCVESVGFLFQAIKVGMSNMETHIQGVHVTLGLHIASPNISGTLNGGIRYTYISCMDTAYVREVSPPPK